MEELNKQAKSDKLKIKPHDTGLFLLGLFCLLLIIFNDRLIVVKGDRHWSSGPLIFPLLTLGVCVLSSLPSAWRIISSHGFSPSAVLSFLKLKRSSAKMLLVLLAFLPCLLLIGVSPTVFILLGIGLFMYGHKKSALIISGTVTLVVWFVFVFLLDIYFPPPLINSLLGGN